MKYKLINNIFALLAGLIFGLGLILAGMANPAIVLGFLDLAGAWNPSLALVMVGAIAIGSVSFAIAKKRQATLTGLTIHLPTIRHIDKRLIIGSLLFGIGWGLAGICPGPAFVLIGIGSLKGILFLISMLVGMGIFELLEIRRHRQNK